jgi:hypothetical protein
MSLVILCGAWRRTLKAEELHKPPMTIALVFADVTSSLDEKQREQIAKLTADAIDDMPVGAEVTLYPIHMAMQRPKPILDPFTVPAIRPMQRRAWKLYKEKRRNQIRENIANLYREVNASPTIDKRTCILDAIVFAGNYFKSRKEPGDRILVIASDMLEECNNTPLQSAIRLNKAVISQEIKAAARFPASLGLSKVRIVLLLPSDNPGKQPYPRPRDEFLIEFWNTIFAKATGNPQISPDWYVGRLPDWLKHLSSQSTGGVD